MKFRFIFAYMGQMKRREAREAKEWATLRPVLMEFRYDHTLRLWRVTFRPRGASVALPRVMHFGDAGKLRDLFQRFGSRRMSEDVAALEFAINSKRGAVELMLGESQLSKLRIGKPPTLNTEHGVAPRTPASRFDLDVPCPLCSQKIPPAQQERLSMDGTMRCPFCGQTFNGSEAFRAVRRSQGSS